MTAPKGPWQTALESEGVRDALREQMAAAFRKGTRRAPKHLIEEALADLVERAAHVADVEAKVQGRHPDYGHAARRIAAGIRREVDTHRLRYLLDLEDEA